MAWLTSTSDYLDRSAEYFDRGSATVQVTPISTRLHRRLIALSATYEVLVIAPFTARALTWPDSLRDGEARPWYYLDDHGASNALFPVGLLIGAVTGVLVSTYLLKALYRGRWTGTAHTKRPCLGPVARSVQLVRHWPLAIAFAFAFVSPVTLIGSQHDVADVGSLVAANVVLLGLSLGIALPIMRRTGRMFDPSVRHAKTIRRAETVSLG